MRKGDHSNCGKPGEPLRPKETDAVRRRGFVQQKKDGQLTIQEQRYLDLVKKKQFRMLAQLERQTLETALEEVQTGKGRSQSVRPKHLTQEAQLKHANRKDGLPKTVKQAPPSIKSNSFLKLYNMKGGVQGNPESISNITSNLTYSKSVARKNVYFAAPKNKEYLTMQHVSSDLLEAGQFIPDKIEVKTEEQEP